MPASSVPPPGRRERCAPTSPTGCGRLGPGVVRRGRRQHPQLAGRPARPARSGSPPTAWSSATLLLAEDPAAPAPRADLRACGASPVARAARRPARASGRSATYGGRRGDPGDVLDVVGVGRAEPRAWCPGPRAAMRGRGRESGRGVAGRAVQQAERGEQQRTARRARPATGRRRAGASGERERRRRRAPGRAPPVGRQPGVVGHRAVERRRRRHLGEHGVDDAGARWRRSSRARACTVIRCGEHGPGDRLDVLGDDVVAPPHQREARGRRAPGRASRAARRR